METFVVFRAFHWGNVGWMEVSCYICADKYCKNMKTEYWGLIPYKEAWSRQRVLFEELISAKTECRPYVNRLIFCEHPHVYTLGKHGKKDNMLLGAEQLQALGAEMVRVDRGGDITYHGLGQVVCYPILCLEDFGLGLKGYIHRLEEAVIRVCAGFGVQAGRMEGATGVWIDGGALGGRKICAIGVRCSRFVTMHGLAMNVNTDLRYFGYIHPCGFVDKGVTSLTKETGSEVDVRKIMSLLDTELRALLVEFK